MGFARGQFQVDYEERIDFERLRRQRVEKAQAFMREEGVDALLLWKDENVKYISSLRAIMLQYRSTTQYGVLLFQEGPPIVFLSGGEYSRARAVMPWIEEFVTIPILEEPGLVETVVKGHIKRLLESRGLAKGRIGLDGMTVVQWQAYNRNLPEAEFVDAETLMQRVRRLKLPDEIKILHEACALADAVTQSAIDAVYHGRRECEVAAEAMRTLFALGGEFAHLANPFVASGERMSPPSRFMSDKIIRHGDVVFIDIGACWNGYFGDVGRTVICGKPSQQQKEIWTTVYECLMTAVETMRPGITNTAVADAVKAKAAERGLEKNFISLFVGHGIGVSPNEPPYIGEQVPGAEEVVLEPGMVFAVEPLIWVPDVRGGGGVRLEDTILITDTGAEPLSRAPFDERLML